MKILYAAKDNMIIPILAAYYHVNLVKNNDLNNGRLILDLLSYKAERGKLMYIGLDEDKNEIYVLNHGGVFKVLENAVGGLSEIYNLECENFILIRLDKYCYGFNFIEFFLKFKVFKIILTDFLCDMVKRRFFEVCKIIDRYKRLFEVDLK